MEGAPNAVLEHISMGLPVIGTRIAAISEIVEEDYSVLFDIGDSEELADLLVDVARGRNKNYRKKLKAKVCRNYSIEAMGKSYLELIESNI